MRSTVSGLFFLTLFLVLGLAIGNRRKCQERHCVQFSKCPSFLKEIKYWKEMQGSGNTEAANVLLKKLNAMVCDRRAGKVCCLVGIFDTGNTAETPYPFEGFVRIVSGVKSPEVSGSVTFKKSRDCDINGPQTYEIYSTNPATTNFAIVPFNGTCNVQEITAIVTGTPIVSCKYNPREGLDFNIKLADGPPPFPPCIIEPTDTPPQLGITVINNSGVPGVPVDGLITGRDPNGIFRAIIYGRQRPIPSGQNQRVRTPFALPTGFGANNHNNRQPCINNNFQPSARYTIQPGPPPSNCDIFSG